MDAKKQRETFLGYANEIKNLGYKVFVKKETKTWPYSNYGWIVNDKDEIGYFQYDAYCGVRFSTVHKPMKEYGCGFGCCDDTEYYTTFTKQIVDRCFATVPNWFRSRPSWEKRHIGKIRKYTATEFLENYWDKKNIVEI